MGIFTSASTEVMRNLEKEVEKKKEELNKEVQLVNENYPIGTLIRFIPKGSSWDVNYGIVVKPAQVFYEDNLIELKNVSLELFVAKFDYRGYLHPHGWSDRIDYYSHFIHKCSLEDVHNFKKQYLTDKVKKFREDIKNIEEHIRGYKKDKNKLNSVMADSIAKFKDETNIEIKEVYGN